MAHLGIIKSSKTTSRRESLRAGSLKSSPVKCAVMFAMSFERPPDTVRIESFLFFNPDSMVLSISLKPAPTEDEVDSGCLGVLQKHWASGRYQHLEANFSKERGIVSLRSRLAKIGLPSVGYLDYACLAPGYFRNTKIMGYGMNWLPAPLTYGTGWLDGKILPLFAVGLSHFILPVDKGGDCQEMILQYQEALLAHKTCGGRSGGGGSGDDGGSSAAATAAGAPALLAGGAPRSLVLEPLSAAVAKSGKERGHPLVCSDYAAARKLALLQRDPDLQFERLDAATPFVRVSLHGSFQNGVSRHRDGGEETTLPSSLTFGIVAPCKIAPSKASKNNHSSNKKEKKRKRVAASPEESHIPETPQHTLARRDRTNRKGRSVALPERYRD
mmetsp:Transcript_81064/g.158389  ORF Transcript_81064/g.158389 Transcript_81064/m.158389 type:complete len:385 (-) Transcript_81064:197-1351(-)